ncbi:hypothetical protein ACDX78_09205 [Virgibacillus oceani]
MSDHFACIALDVVDSRKMAAATLEKLLRTLTEDLNSKYANDMLMPFTIRNGDEVIGIFYRFAMGCKALEHIFEKTGGFSVYAGCGFGKMNTMHHIDVHTSNSLAIIYAMEARDQFLKNSKKKAAIWNKDFTNKVFFYAENFPYQAINSQFYTLRSYKQKRSEKQRQIIAEMNKYPRKTYEEIGKMFNYKNPRASISNHLSAANYELVNEMEKSLMELLDMLQYFLEQVKS